MLPQAEGVIVSIMNERIEAAFQDEYNRVKHEGIDRLLEKTLAEVLYLAYRRGYIRGHSDRSKEVHLDEEQARREGRYPMNVEIRHVGDKLILEGRDVTPKRDDPLPEYRPNH